MMSPDSSRAQLLLYTAFRSTENMPMSSLAPSVFVSKTWEERVGGEEGGRVRVETGTGKEVHSETGQSMLRRDTAQQRLDF